jgi:hypothetical protein
MPDHASRRKVKSLPFHSASKGNCQNGDQRRPPKPPQISGAGERSPFPLRSGILRNCGGT